MVGRPARRPERTTTVNSGRRRRRACAGSTSGGELLAALAATAGKDGAAGAGTHAEPEAVGLGPTTVVRLERALAHEVLPLTTTKRWTAVEPPTRRHRPGATRRVPDPCQHRGWWCCGQPRATSCRARANRPLSTDRTSIAEERAEPADGPVRDPPCCTDDLPARSTTRRARAPARLGDGLAEAHRCRCPPVDGAVSVASLATGRHGLGTWTGDPRATPVTRLGPHPPARR